MSSCCFIKNSSRQSEKYDIFVQYNDQIILKMVCTIENKNNITKTQSIYNEIMEVDPSFFTVKYSRDFDNYKNITNFITNSIKYFHNENYYKDNQRQDDNLCIFNNKYTNYNLFLHDLEDKNNNTNSMLHTQNVFTINIFRKFHYYKTNTKLNSSVFVFNYGTKLLTCKVNLICYWKRKRWKVVKNDHRINVNIIYFIGNTKKNTTKLKETLCCFNFNNQDQEA